VFITRRRFDDGSLYLGPYPNVKKLKQSLRALRSIFPFVSCKSFSKTACLYYHLKLCPGPCIQEVDKEEYRKNILSLIKALLGDMDEVIKDLTREMDKCVAEGNFEKAALFRDKIKALGKVSSLFGEDRSINVLENIKEKLNLPHLPRVIDAVDISNVGGKMAVGSFVRFRDSEPDKNFYRRFKLKREGFVDDYEMMAEVVLRRFKDILELNEGIPDLLMVDGGKGHLNRIDKVLKEELGLDIPIIAYAKGKDVIHSKYRMQEVSFPDGSSEKNLLERIRDEAHRFAIGYHKLLRKRKAKESILDEIPGIGEEKKKLILSQVAKLKDLEEMSLADLKRIKGIGDKLAERIYVYLRQKKDREVS
jgi:excinuclease ABC subunit C